MAVGNNNMSQLVDVRRDGKWHEVTVPHGKYADLAGVSCVGKSHCVAVGSTWLEASNTYPNIAETWNGRSWTLAQLKDDADSLEAISCATTDFCVAAPASEVKPIYMLS
jgi:hypothetical protein